LARAPSNVGCANDDVTLTYNDAAVTLNAVTTAA
jgi:hypothetical protein